MANSDIPSGAKPNGELLRATRYVAGGTIYPGDFVIRENTGKVLTGAASTALLGVALDYAVLDGNVLVADDPDQRFSCQVDSTDIAAQTNLGLNYNIVATAGNSSYRRSNHEINVAVADVADPTLATLPIKIISIVSAPNNAFGANVKAIFYINNHALGGHTGTAGV